jgi:hypothetical protein
MRAHSKVVSMALFLGLTHSCVVSQSSAPETKPVLQGVVVESLLSKFEGERVGLQNGDVLLAWARGDAKGDINSPFDLPYIRLEQASRGTVQLEGLRGLEKRTWTPHLTLGASLRAPTSKEICCRSTGKNKNCCGPANSQK